ncbi:hypothetical protein [Streptomyces sp. NPDC020480]|uniref:hypothetical protein n=1 Tax=Streptomyces sp. NPDC020480 TaxID=3365076 RepID=UPI0037ADF497
MSHDSFERTLVGGLLVFAASVGLLSTVGLLLVIGEQAAKTAAAIGAAGPAGIGITLSLRKGK